VGWSSEEKVNNHWNLLCQTHETDGNTIDDVYNTINENIRFLNFEIRKIIFEFDSHIYWAICNSIQDDESSKLSTGYNETQIALFKRIFDYCIEHNGCMPAVDANSIFNKEPKLKMDHAKSKNTIILLVKQGWLCDKDEKTVCIGPRSYMELRKYIQDYEPPKCGLCQISCIHGESCSSSTCSSKLHWYCAKKFFFKEIAQRSKVSLLQSAMASITTIPSIYFM